MHDDITVSNDFNDSMSIFHTKQYRQSSTKIHLALVMVTLFSAIFIAMAFERSQREKYAMSQKIASVQNLGKVGIADNGQIQ